MGTSDLAKSLQGATEVVKRFVDGEISAASFIESYSNYYYYEALDGHEPSSAQDVEGRSKYWIAIELHRRIQEEVINRLTLSSNVSVASLHEAGLILEPEARERARAICSDKGVDAILESLES